MNRERLITVFSIVGLFIIWWWTINSPKVIPVMVFTDQKKTFSFNHLKDFSVISGGKGYMQDGMAVPAMILAIVDIPKTIEPNTNFAGAQFTVLASADPKAIAKCMIVSNSSELKSEQVVINNIPYTKLLYGDSGAGNFYEITGYRTIYKNRCYSINYSIHSLNINNFPKGQIEEFNKDKIKGILDGMAQSFKFL